MNTLMPDKLILATEFLIAALTSERLKTGMNNTVPIKLAFADEALTALGTNVLPDSQVNVLMVL